MSPTTNAPTSKIQSNLKKILTVILVFISMHTFCQIDSGKKHVVIKGKVNDWTENFDGKKHEIKHDEVHVLAKYNMRQNLVSEKIKNGEVEFKFYFDEFKQYCITPALGQINARLSFYPDADTIYFSILPDDEPSIKGGELTNDYTNKLTDYYDSFDDAYEKIIKKHGEAIFKHEDGKKVKINPIAHQKLDSLRKVFYANRFKDHPQNPKLSDYNLFLDKIWIASAVQSEEINDIQQLANYFIQQINNPVYHKLTRTFVTDLVAHHTLKKGADFVNVSVQDSDRSTVQLADFVGRNQYLLLDIWATWCGPCIGKSKKVIPMYKAYQTKGFGVFSIMTEVGSFKEYVELKKKYDYPWAVYSDIENENGIRTKYGTNDSGGVQILLNKDGKIVKVNPTAEELEQFLRETL